MGKKDDFYGGQFDYNQDGKTSLFEKMVAYKIFDDIYKNKNQGKHTSSKPHRTPKTTNPVVKESDEVILSTVPEKPDTEQYKSEKKKYLSIIRTETIAGSLLLFIPAIIIYVTIISYDGQSVASGLVSSLFMSAGLAITGFIIHFVYLSIRPTILKLGRLKNNYIDAISDEERARIKRKKKKRKIILLSVVSLLLIVLISIGIASSVHKESIYSKAGEHISAHEYSEGLNLLNQIESSYYKDTTPLIALCEAHLEYDKGHIVQAYNTLKGVTFLYQGTQQSKAIKDFRETLFDAYVNYERQEDQSDYENKTTIDVPFVGMNESRIISTLLGTPETKIGYDYEYIKGKQYVANLYNFYSDSKKIFTARCVNNMVAEVWDYRNSSVYTSNYSSGKNENSNDDPYDARDYADAEDFYDDNYDDFYDYEDAEDYYDEHN